jgi:hypothetical protein
MTAGPTPTHVVELELQRVQTFLFSVPRLRAMVGANTLLGEALRVHLPRLAREHEAAPIDLTSLDLPARDPDDPLRAPSPENDPSPESADELADDARAQFRRGILHRDGGHFAAVFASEQRAIGFARATEAFLADDLPGLAYTLRMRPLGLRAPREATARERQLLDLPQAQVCQASGRGPASVRVPLGGGARLWTSRHILDRFRAGGRAARGRALDTASLLGQRRSWRRPQDLAALAGGGYLAVIHADGNGVGALAAEATSKLPKVTDPASELLREAAVEGVFHRMRVATRRALVAALEATFGGVPDGEVRPYQLLMQGGDDLLLVCAAGFALPFVNEYARALDELKLGLTIGAGVVVSRPSVPFHRLHELVEALASSAKVLHRALPEGDKAKTSVVDWMVTTDASPGDPLRARRDDALVSAGGERLVLTRRPLRVRRPGVADAEQGLDTLAGLLRGAGALTSAARSQLRALVPALRAGRLASTLLRDELPAATRAALEGAGLSSLWIEVKAGEATYHLTSLADLVEVYELSRLGRGTATADRAAGLATQEAGR